MGISSASIPLISCSRGCVGVFLSLIFLISCSNNPFEQKDERSIVGSEIKGMYVLRKGPDNLYGLYYTNYDPIKFTEIEGCKSLSTLYLNKENHLLIGASQKKLYFISTIKNQKIGEIFVPNTTTPKSYIYDDTHSDILDVVFQPFPCYWSSDHIILVNRSVYLLDLKSLNVVEIIWNSESYGDETYIQDVVLSDNARSLYLELSLGYQMAQRLSELNLKTGQINTIYDYPKEQAPGSKFVFSSKDYIMSYDPNSDYITRFSVLSKTLIDSFMVTQSDFLWWPYSNGTNTIVQDGKTGTFYRIYPEIKELELYMQLSFQKIGGTTYQKLKSGDLYACIPNTSADNSLIINLSQNILVREFKNDLINFIILKDD